MFLSRENRYQATQSNFSQIPGSPIAYWVNERVNLLFSREKQLSDYSDVKVGIQTGDNNKFYRSWFEVNHNKIAWTSEEVSSRLSKWYKCVRGGNFRKWYGNIDTIINWENDGAEVKACKSAVIRGTQYYFRPSFSWTEISSSNISFRMNDDGAIFDQKGPSVFCENEKLQNYLCALMNSNSIQSLLNILCPTMDYSVGPVSKVPVIVDRVDNVSVLGQGCVQIARDDWDSFETSWDFKKHPLV